MKEVRKFLYINLNILLGFLALVLWVRAMLQKDWQQATFWLLLEIANDMNYRNNKEWLTPDAGKE